MILSHKPLNWFKAHSNRISFWLLLATVLFYRSPISFAQGPSSFTKVGSVSTTSFVDSSVTSGQVLEYAVTATNAAGESGPSNIVTATTPTTAVSHSNTLVWNASVGATGYNVYRFLVQVPAAPGSLAVTSQ